MQLNIRRKFLIPTVLLVVIGLGITTTVTYTKARTALSNAIDSEMNQVVKATLANLNSWIERNRRDLAAWSNEEVLIRALSGNANDRNAASTRLAEYKEKYGFYENIFVVDASGELIAGSHPAALGKVNISDYPFFKKAMTGELNMSDPIPSGETGNPVITIAAPLREGGQVRGMLFSVIDLMYFSHNFVDPIKVGEMGYAYILAPDGTVIAHPNKKLILETNIKQFDFGKKMLDIKKGILRYKYNGKPKIAALDRSQLGWIFAVSADEDDLLKPIMAMASAALTIAIIILVLLGLAMWFMTAGMITNPISKVSQGLKDVAQGEGDLTKRLQILSRDEIGELSGWFNTFIEHLEEVIAGVKNSATHVDTATEEVSAGSQGLSQATQEQASAIEEVAATIEEMTSAIKNNANNAAQGLSQARDMVNFATDSREISEKLIQSMNEISEASNKIGDIIITVNEVAFQTNLLALNAAVEAARAGEHGKGFAVVAEEVRSLAQRSAESAHEVRALIEDTTSKIAGGDEMVQKSGQSLQEIIQRIEGLSQTMEEIAASSSEQANGIDELNRAVSQIDSTTQQNASTVEELASTADSLKIEASGLADSVGRFRVSAATAVSREPAAPARRTAAPPDRPAPPQASSSKKIDSFDEEDFEEF